MEAQIKTIFSSTISHLLETSEAVFGEHPQWRFYRKVLLKRLNDLYREINSITEGEGKGYERLSDK